MASMPSAVARWVLPVPTGPMRTTLREAERNALGVHLVPNHCNQIHGSHPGRVTLALRWPSTRFCAGGSGGCGRRTQAPRERREVGQFLMAEMGQFKMAADTGIDPAVYLREAALADARAEVLLPCDVQRGHHSALAVKTG